MQARLIRRHHHGRSLTRQSGAGRGAGLPTLQLLAVFILLGAAGLSGIGHSSSTSNEAAPAGATAEEQLCESIDQCAGASPTQDPIAASEPTEAEACSPDESDAEMAAGADELHTADSIDDPEEDDHPEAVADPFAGARNEKGGGCTDTLTPQIQQ